MRMRDIMRIVEGTEDQLGADLQAAYQEFEAFRSRFDPNDHETFSRYWREKVKPLEDQYNAAVKQARITANQELRQRLQVPDGFSSEILYHGSNAEFIKFDRSKGRTAEHIYTSPDIETAKGYGDHLYQLFGRQKPQADISSDTSDFGLIRRIHRAGGFKQSFGLSLKELSELIDEGQLYQSQASSVLQDRVIDTCFSLKFRSVRMTDPTHGGGFSDSVIFDDPNDLHIVKRLS